MALAYAALALIETSGNQRFIFGSNRLREQIGASEMIHRIGYGFVSEAIKKQRSSRAECDAICLASGKAVIACDTVDTAKAIVTDVTMRALDEAPGADVQGAVQKIEPGQALHDAVRDVFHTFDTLRGRWRSVDHRFQHLPPAAICDTSGLPAEILRQYGTGRPAPLSRVSFAKEDLRDHAYARMRRDLGVPAPLDGGAVVLDIDERFADVVDGVEDLRKRSKDLAWLAVVHIDGNGLGRIFQSFAPLLAEVLSLQTSDPAFGQAYRRHYADFSAAIDACAREAFRKALCAVAGIVAPGAQRAKVMIPVAPLILGGDDVTFVADARIAVDLTRHWLQAFEALTAAHKDISPIAKEALGSERLSACAGIAIVRPHFPFHVAYDLAEELCGSAKRFVKGHLKPPGRDDPFPCSALDVHIHFDASGGDLDAIRERQTAFDGDALLFGGPYVVTDQSHLEASRLSEGARKLAVNRHWTHLEQALAALSDRLDEGDDEGSLLPSTGVHALRDVLWSGRQATNNRLALLVGRDAGTKRESRWRQLSRDQESLDLFFATEDRRQATRLYDAMRLAKLAAAIETEDFVLPDEQEARSTQAG